MVDAGARPIGLLTLQGDYEKHRQAFAVLGRETFSVRRTSELSEVGSLVIPGVMHMTPAYDPSLDFGLLSHMMEEESRRNHRGGAVKKEPWRRNHGGGSM